MLRNDIYRCRASGIFLRLEGGGLIAGNNIYHNAEAGVDIRKKSNPLILVILSVLLPFPLAVLFLCRNFVRRCLSTASWFLPIFVCPQDSLPKWLVDKSYPETFTPTEKSGTWTRTFLRVPQNSYMSCFEINSSKEILLSSLYNRWI